MKNDSDGSFFPWGYLVENYDITNTNSSMMSFAVQCCVLNIHCLTFSFSQVKFHVQIAVSTTNEKVLVSLISSTSLHSSSLSLKPQFYSRG